jgi:hypothetical protein
MNENYFERIIKKQTKSILLAILVLILITAAVFLSNMKLLSTLYSPLSSIKSSAAATELFKQEKVYAQMENADMYFLDYGIYTYTTRNGVKTSDEKLSQVFGVVKYDDGYLLVLAPKSYLDLDETKLQSVSATCKVQDLSENENYNKAYDGLIDELTKSAQISREEAEKYVPKLCVTIQEDGRTFDQAFISIDMLVLFLLVIFMIINFMVIFNYRKSKSYQQLYSFGNAEDVEYSINQSVECGNYLYKSEYRPTAYIGLLSYEYIIGKCGSSLKVFPTRELIWVHLKVVKQKAYFITVNKSYQVLFYIRGVKKPVSILFKNESQANETIQKISNSLPVLCVYDKNLAHTYRSNYAEFLQIAENYSDEYNGNKEKNVEQSNQG